MREILLFRPWLCPFLSFLFILFPSFLLLGTPRLQPWVPPAPPRSGFHSAEGRSAARRAQQPIYCPCFCSCRCSFSLRTTKKPCQVPKPFNRHKTNHIRVAW